MGPRLTPLLLLILLGNLPARPDTVTCTGDFACPNAGTGNGPLAVGGTMADVVPKMVLGNESLVFNIMATNVNGGDFTLTLTDLTWDDPNIAAGASASETIHIIQNYAVSPTFVGPGFAHHSFDASAQFNNNSQSASIEQISTQNGISLPLLNNSVSSPANGAIDGPQKLADGPAGVLVPLPKTWVIDMTVIISLSGGPNGGHITLTMANSADEIGSVPEPGTMWLTLAGVGALVRLGRRCPGRRIEA